MLIFNSTKTTQSICSCIFSFVDNSIAGTEESSAVIFFFLFSLQQHSVGTLKCFDYKRYLQQYVFTQPLRQEQDQFFKRNKIFLRPILNRLVVVPGLTNPVDLNPEKTDGFPRELSLTETQTASYGIWTRVADLSSDNDNYYAKPAS